MWFNSTHWRWDRIVSLVDAGLKPKNGFDDIYVKKGIEFYKKLQDKSQQEAVKEKYPELFAIYTWFKAETQIARMVEAMVLARQTPEQIGEYLSVSPAIVEKYEKYFFAVREKLNARGYILFKVLGLPNALTADIFNLWKRVGYFGGIEQLKALWEHKSLTPELENEFKALIKSKIIKDAFIAVTSTNVDQENCFRIIENYIKMKRLEAETENQQQSKSESDKIIHELLSAIHFTITDDVDAPPSKEPSLYDLNKPENAPGKLPIKN